MPGIESFGTTEGFNPLLIIISILLAFGLSYIIALLYKYTHKGMSYSQSFTQTLVILSVISAAAMMVIGSSLARAFGLAGALSIVRFRTVVKDSKDIAYVFWSLVVGMACGTQGYLVGIIGTSLVAVTVLILHRSNFGSIRKHDYILRYYQDIKAVTNEQVQDILQTFFKSCVLLTMNTHESGKVFEFSYNIQFINEAEQENLLKELSALKGISNVYLLRATNDVDY
jgi:uncharacterized membrane protein YhiD involved in acid resistance